MMRLGLVGIGYGWTLAREILEAQERLDCRLVAVAARNFDDFPDRRDALKEAGVELVDDAFAMFNSGKIDAAYIATGTGSHRPMATAAMQAGLDVHLEKPPAATIQDVDAMLQVQRETGRLCLVGYQAVQSTEVRETRRLIAGGQIGRVESVSCWASWPRTLRYYTRNDWAGKLRHNEQWVLDGPATNAFAHQIVNLLAFAAADEKKLAEPVGVRAELYHANPIAGHDTAAIEMITADRVPCRFMCTHAGIDWQNPIITIKGTEGQIDWNYLDTSTARLKDGSRRVIETDPEERFHMIENFIQAVRSRDESILRCTLAESRKFTLALNAAHESSRRIHPIPESAAERINLGTEEEQSVVENIIPMMQTAAREGTLLSDLPDAPKWAAVTERFDTSTYREFPQHFQT